MNKYLTIGLISLLTSCIVALIVICYNKSNVIDLLVDDYQKISSVVATVNDRLVEISSIGYNLEEVMLQNENEEIVNMSNVLSKSRNLIFRFSSFHCNACYESQMELMSSFVSDFYSLIMLVNNEANIRQIKMLNAAHSVQASVYKLVENNLPMPIDSIGKPYYFTLTDDFITANCYVPDKGLPDLSVKYLNGALCVR
jgi:hypothetical protein